MANQTSLPLEWEIHRLESKNVKEPASELMKTVATRVPIKNKMLNDFSHEEIKEIEDRIKIHNEKEAKRKEELTEEIIEPIKNPKRAELDLMEYGKEVPKGVLLYGPPGCGKTYIVEALAQELDTVVYKLGIDKAGSKYINETSTNIRKSFDYAEAAARTFEKPVVLFMDEIDSLIMKRSEALNEENLKQVATLLQCIEHAQQNNVIVVGATNRYELIDPAAIRRFPVKKPVLSPETPQIKEHLKRSLEKKYYRYSGFR